MLFWAAVALVIMLPIALTIRNNPQYKGYGPDWEPIDRVKPIDTPTQQENPARDSGPGVKRSSNFSEAVRSRSFWFLSASHLICGVGCGFMLTHVVAFATDVGYSEMIGASLVSVQGGANLVGLLVTGPLSDRIVRKNVLALTHFVRSMSFVSFVIFVVLGGDSLWLLYMAIVFFGFGWFTTAPLAAGLVADLFGSLSMGTILGVVTSCHMFGAAIGAYAGGAIFESTHSYYLFFVIQGILEFLAVIFAFSIKQKSATRIALAD